MHRLGPRLLLYAGTTIAVVGASLVHASRHGYTYTGSFRFAWSIAYTASLCATAYGFGFPDLLERGGRAVVQALAAVGVAALFISTIQLFVGDALLPRFVVFGSAGLLVPWYVTCAAVAGGGWARAGERARVLFVGDQADAEVLKRDLSGSAERPAQLVAAVEVAQVRPTAGGVDPLYQMAAEERARVIVLSREAQADDAVVRQAARLHEEGIRVRTLSLFYEQWLGKLPVGELERISLMFDISELHRALYTRATRVIDVVLAAVGLALLLPLIVFVFVGDLIANRGSLFYTQPRIGKNGKVFRIFKFRTMRSTTPGPINEWTTEDDPRITPFGRMLRRSHLDEVPQVINILRGELSFVGPRPEQPTYVDELVMKLPFYSLRHLVRPGVTGWAQVKYGYAGSETDALEKLQYEFYYLRHQSLSLDLRILIRTIRSVVGRRGR